LTINQFRGIRHLRVDGLRRINLFVGRNNSGKTTVLEALFLLGGATNPVFPTTLGQLRGQRLGATYPDAVWRPLFFNLDPRQQIELHAEWDDEHARRRLAITAAPASSYADVLEPAVGGGGGVAAVTEEFLIGGLRLHYTDARDREYITKATFDPKSGNVDAPSTEREDFVRATFLSARAYSSLLRDAQQYSFLVKIKQEQDVLDAMKVIEARVERIEVLSEPGGPAVYVDLGLPSLVPLAACGEGFVRMFSIIVELTASRRGVLLVDEIDNGLHYSVMEELWKLLGVLSEKHDVQIFGTTHNEELIQSALTAYQDDLTQLGLFRIDRKGTEHSVAAYNSDTMEAVREEAFEVRG
jgi:predicted ATPase